MTLAEAIAIQAGQAVEADLWAEAVEHSQQPAQVDVALTLAQRAALLALGPERFAQLVMLGAQVALDRRTN